MRTIYPVLLVFAMAVAGLMFQLSGFNAHVGQDNHVDRLSDEMEDRANESAVAQDGSFEASARTQGGGLIGFVISGVGTIVDMASMVAMLPWELNTMGFPYWFSFPVGLSVQALVGIGVVQFASGRVWR